MICIVFFLLNKMRVQMLHLFWVDSNLFIHVYSMILECDELSVTLLTNEPKLLIILGTKISTLFLFATLVLGMAAYPGTSFNSVTFVDSINSPLVLAFAQTDDDTEDEIDNDEDIKIQGTIVAVNDDGSFDLETSDGIETILTDDDTIIDDGLELSDIVGLVVDIDVIDIDGSLLATEIEFDDGADEELDEIEEEIEIEVEIEDGVAKIKVEINDEELKFEMEWVDEQTTIDEIALQTDLTIE